MMPNDSKKKRTNGLLPAEHVKDALPRRRWSALVAALPLLCCPSGLWADDIGYAADEVLRTSTVNIDKGTMTLEQFIGLCQTQTSYKFVYQKTGIPADTLLTLPVGSGQKLSDLFKTVSDQSGVVFQRLNGQIVVRKANADEIDARDNNSSGDSTEDASMEIFMLDTITVEAERMKTEKMMVEIRMQDVRFMNVLSNEDFARFSLGDMGEAATKIAGVNVMGGRFAVIRGLSERFSSTLVNGIPVPTSDPEKQGVHLDMFSSDIVDRLEVYKTFSPDAPGNASGGYLNIVTTNIPHDSFAKVKFGIRFNDRAQNDFVTYDTPSSDLWAKGAKGRIYDVFGDHTYTDGNGNVHNDKDRFDFGSEKIFITKNGTLTLPEGVDMTAHHASPPQGVSFETSFGTGTRELWGHFFRAMGTVSYNSTYKTSDGEYQERWPGTHYQWYTSDYDLEYVSPRKIPHYVPALWYGEMNSHDPLYDYTKSVASVDISAMAALQLDLDRKGAHKITLTALATQSGTDTVVKMENGKQILEDQGEALADAYPDINSQFTSQLGQGTFAKGHFGDLGSDAYEKSLVERLYWNLLYYEERTLGNLQLKGDHLFTLWDNPLKITWAASYSETQTREPDARSTEYYYNTEEGLYYAPGSGDDSSNNYRSWRYIDENQKFYRTDIDYDCSINSFLKLRMNTGFSTEDSYRHALQGRKIFIVRTDGYLSSSDTEEGLFSAGNYDVKSSKRDVNCEATRDLASGYFNTVATLFDDWDLIAGLRLERVKMSSTLISAANAESAANVEEQIAQYMGYGDGGDGSYLDGSLNHILSLPSVGLAYRPIDKLSLRLNYSQTYSRPSFREYMPYLAFTPESLSTNLGNPQLELSHIKNLDFRTEYAWGNKGDLIAASAFYKEVENPIEKISYRATAWGGFTAWVNNENTAYLSGAEFEWRFHLDFLGVDWLDNFSIGGNTTLIKARVHAPQAALDNATKYLWSPWVFYSVKADNKYIFPEDVAFDHQPVERRLFDQPSWIVNTDISYEFPSCGTRLTLACYAISEVMTASGSYGKNYSTLDEYADSYYQLDFTWQQKLTERLSLKFSAKNFTDTTRGVVYDPYLTTQKYYKLKYKAGRDFTLSLSYDF